MRRISISIALLLVCAAGFAGCGATNASDAGAGDASTDSGPSDAAVELDAGSGDASVETDTGGGAEDAELPDAGSLDAGPFDTGSVDASTDGGMMDGGMMDAGEADAGSADTGIQPKPKTSIATVTADDLTVELLTDTQFETGLNPIYLKIATTSGQPVTDAGVMFMDKMTMSGGKIHSGPIFGPPVLDADGFYRCDAVFQMASSALDFWDLIVTVKRTGVADVVATFEKVAVTESGRATVFTYTDPGTSAVSKYIVSLNFESAPEPGLNPITVTLHTMKDMMTFPAVEGAAMVLEPKMPLTGQGCTGSIDPAMTSPGRYNGKLKFSSAGTWETTVTTGLNGVTLGAPKFTTTF